MTHNRILIFSTDDHLYPAGGAEQAFGNITERLSHIEFDLICAKLRKGALAYEQVKNVHIHRMGFGIPKIDGIMLALFGHHCARKLMKQHQYDLVWSIMASYGAFSAVRVKKATGLPFLLTLQEGDSFEYIYERVKYVRKSFNEIFSIADGIQAISTYLLNWGREMGYVGTHDRVIPNGVDIEAYTAPLPSEVLESTRTSFGFKEDAFILITSSRLEKKNGIIDVVRALPLLPSNICFVICGSGSLHDSIQSEVAQLGVTSRVKFMGFVEPKELPRLMKASDAFIRPSLTEGLGNAFLEAMAARVPVVGTLAGGISDFLTDEVTGFVVGIQDSESIATAVKKVIALDDTKKELLLNTAEQMVKDRYDWDLVTKEMEKLFIELTA